MVTRPPLHFCRRRWLLFVALAVRQEKLLASIRYRTRAISFYERGLARLNDRWAGAGETGERFLDPAHPYARDLDLFGRASLFEYLSSARTRAGEETLARWLLNAAPPDEILARQDAIRELRTRGSSSASACFLRAKRSASACTPTRWPRGERPSHAFPHAACRIVVSVLALLWILSVVAWARGTCLGLPCS